jgi:hypothetical protein
MTNECEAGKLVSTQVAQDVRDFIMPNRDVKLDEFSLAEKRKNLYSNIVA